LPHAGELTVSDIEAIQKQCNAIDMAKCESSQPEYKAEVISQASGIHYFVKRPQCFIAQGMTATP
jgi:hypothetical protein